MQMMEADMKLHELMRMSMLEAAIADALDETRDHFVWVVEVLSECKNKFSSSHLLPKTPSQKKPAKRRVKRNVSKDSEKSFETVSGSPVVATEQPTDLTSKTPVRRLRSTRSRAAQSSTSTLAGRSSRTAAKQTAEENETSVVPPKKSQEKNVKINLPSVSESETTPDMLSPKPSGSSDVRSRARAYESMLSGRTQGSPITPKSASKETPKTSETPKSSKKDDRAVTTEAKPTASDSDLESKDTHGSGASGRKSGVGRRSSSAAKRLSHKVLGSKAKLKSLQGRLSVTGAVAAQTKEIAETEQEEETQVTSDERKEKESPVAQAKAEEKETKSKPIRTRLRLKKSNKSATDSASETSTSNESQMEAEDNTAATVSVSDNTEPSPARSSSRTKRKKQKSASSEDEPLQAKTSASDAESSNEDGGRSRTRTKARKVETAASTEVEEMQQQESSAENTESKSSASDSSEGGRRPRTRARKVESKDTASSEETMDTEGSVFESPVSNGNRRTRSGARSSAGLSAVTADSGVLSNSPETRDSKAYAASVSEVVEEEQGTDSVSRKSEEGSRRDTRVISQAEPLCSEEEEGRPTRSTRTKTRQAQKQSMDNDKASEESEQPRMTRTKARKRQAEEEAADTSVSKRSCVELEASPRADQHDDGDKAVDADDDSDYEDMEPDEPPTKMKKTVPSFLSQFRKSSLSRSTCLVSGVVSSFLQRGTPQRKPNYQHIQEQKKKELVQKEKKDKDRLTHLEILRRNKAEEQRRKREERMRKVAEMREMRQMKESDLKKNLAEKLKERLNSTDRMKEDKFKEEREKQKLRLKRQLEADERRRQEEEVRVKKLLEQQEQDRRQEDILQRKKEHEEKERARRKEEDRRRQEELKAEAERQQKAEQDRLCQQELEREKEQLKDKELKERQAAQERAERDRQELGKKKEREQKIQKELEKLKELEQLRLARMVAQDEEKRREEVRLQQIIQQHNRNLQNLGFNSTLTLTSSTVSKDNGGGVVAVKSAPLSQHNGDSYAITPVRQKKKASMENYDIADMRSDDSTDDDEAPRKKIPSWAQGANLKASLINQAYHPPDLNSIFPSIAPPDLNEMFERKRARFNKRTSSAVWNSPLHKPHSHN
ncbi:inner centromere protein-like [Littorina saxatilis]|uniref:Inner centromere protein ARK-binding domain-containing protein n=2 Tax=Littorina saxatilis TaxID=31220 RepID=A0AAN9BP54_9CAEN